MSGRLGWEGTLITVVRGAWAPRRLASLLRREPKVVLGDILDDDGKALADGLR